MRDLKKNSTIVKTTIAPIIFLLGAFLVAAIASLVTSMIFIAGQEDIALHYEQLRSLFLTATWFAVTWALYFVRSSSKKS